MPQVDVVVAPPPTQSPEAVTRQTREKPEKKETRVPGSRHQNVSARSVSLTSVDERGV